MASLVLGSSNGIFKDGYWTSIDAHTDFGPVRNISLGASPVTMAPYRLKDIDLGAYRHLFVEAVIHDAVAAQVGFFSLDVPTDQTRWLLTAARQAGVVPIGVLLTQMDETPAAAELCRRYNRLYGGLCLEVNSVIRAIAAAAGREHQEFYRDVSHPKPEVFRAVMTAFVSKLAALGPDRFAPRSLPPGPSYSFLPAAKSVRSVRGPAPRRVSIRTSFANDEAVCFDEGTGVAFDVPPGMLLAGIVSNQSNTHCFARVTGAYTLHKDMRFGIENGGPKMIVTPLAQPLPSKQGVFELQLRSFQTPYGVTERSYFTRRDRIELSGFILQSSIVRPAPVVGPNIADLSFTPADIAALAREFMDA